MENWRWILLINFNFQKKFYTFEVFKKLINLLTFLFCGHNQPSIQISSIAYFFAFHFNRFNDFLVRVTAADILSPLYLKIIRYFRIIKIFKYFNYFRNTFALGFPNIQIN